MEKSMDIVVEQSIPVSMKKKGLFHQNSERNRNNLFKSQSYQVILNTYCIIRTINFSFEWCTVNLTVLEYQYKTS